LDQHLFLAKGTSMKKASRITTTLAAAAMTGLVAGAGVTLVGGCSNSAGTSAGDKVVAPHDCKGQNACKGQGGCKTGNQGCKGQNSCKGQGGCKVAA
jgi:hypothetical protein